MPKCDNSITDRIKSSSRFNCDIDDSLTHADRRKIEIKLGLQRLSQTAAEVLKNRTIILCLLAIMTVLIVAALTNRPIKYSDTYLQEVYEEVSCIKAAVYSPKSSDMSRHFAPRVKKALLDIKGSYISYSENRIMIYVDNLSRTKIRLLKRVFPNDCIVYVDATVTGTQIPLFN